jgi:aspartyl-tRNA(Asn)/glutamyl-tRNA(Gln) amidotransferase subunit C
MKLEDIKKLAEMSRIDMTEEEMLEIGDSFDGVLSYVGQIKEAGTDNVENENIISNVMREDEKTNISGEFTEEILNQMPDTEKGFLKVKRVL